MITKILMPIHINIKEDVEGLGQVTRDAKLYKEQGVLVITTLDYDDRYPYAYSFSVTHEEIEKLQKYSLNHLDGSPIPYPESQEVPTLNVKWMAQTESGDWLEEDDAYEQLGEDVADELEFLPIPQLD